jgi:lipopolysaccharide export system protein LptC
LFEKAKIVRERFVDPKGKVLPRSEISSDFLHVFANTEKIKTHLPVEMVRDNGDRFIANWMDYDNLEQVLQLQGRVKGVIMPRTTKKAP